MSMVHFHRHELAFCGFSNSGKSTLVSALISRLSKRFKVGYVKHDAHRFEMDKEGKDTWKAAQAGASRVQISNDKKWATLSSTPVDAFSTPFEWLDMDMVLVEGHKGSDLPKILLIDDGKILEQLPDNVIAQVTIDGSAPIEGIPAFQRDDLEAIENFTLKWLTDNRLNRPLYGLVLTGGKSSRMGRDKGALNWHGEDQVRHLYKLLNDQCQKAFVSCRADQTDLPFIKGLPVITDTFLDAGPTAGMLSAMQKHPEAAWLVVACDLPWLDEQGLKQLIQARNPWKLATCFENPEKGWPEPLCTIWEPLAQKRLMQFLALNRKCPRKVLFNSNIQSIRPSNKRLLDNANTPEERERIQNLMNNEERHP